MISSERPSEAGNISGSQINLLKALEPYHTAKWIAGLGKYDGKGDRVLNERPSNLQ